MQTMLPIPSSACGPVGDPELPTMTAALDPAAAEAALRDPLASLSPGGRIHVEGARVLAHKPGRRCLIEYALRLQHEDGSCERLVALGKIRAGRSGRSGDRLLRAFWNAGFSAGSADNISVPEPLGAVPALRMWMQRKVEGQLASVLVPLRGAEATMERLARAVVKLHAAGVPATRRHTMADELRILDRCLAQVATQRPTLASCLERLMRRCERAAALLPEPAWCGSHRDFYADQAIVAGSRVFLLDFDLYCEADPGLDVGNFLGHVAEQAIRMAGHPAAFEPVERALEERFVGLAGEHVRASVQVYAALTLARHVYLSARIAGREALVGAMLEAADERLGRVMAEGGHA